MMEILLLCTAQTTQEGSVKFSSIPAPQPPASTVATVPTTHQLLRDTPANVRVGDFIRCKIKSVSSICLYQTILIYLFQCSIK